MALADAAVLVRLQERLRALVLAQHVALAQLVPALTVLVDALMPVQLQERVERGHRARGLDLVRLPDGSGWWVRQADVSWPTAQYYRLGPLTTRRPRQPPQPARPRRLELPTFPGRLMSLVLLVVVRDSVHL